MAPPGVFISHTSSDKPFARRLASDLARAGAVVWLDEAEILVGDSLIEKITAGIDQTDFLAVLLSKASADSEWVRREVAIAMDEEIAQKTVKVLPLLLEDCDLPAFLKGKVYADFRSSDGYPRALHQVLRRLDLLGAVVEKPMGSLSADTSLSHTELRRLGAALRSPDEDIPFDAMERLVADRSVAAAEVLFADALEDIQQHSTWGGLGVAGLVELGPAASYYLNKLLTHEHDETVRHAFHALGQVAFQMTREMWEELYRTVEAIMEEGEWQLCRRRLAETMTADEKYGDAYVDTLTEVLRYADALSGP